MVKWKCTLNCFYMYIVILLDMFFTLVLSKKHVTIPDCRTCWKRIYFFLLTHKIHQHCQFQNFLIKRIVRLNRWFSIFQFHIANIILFALSFYIRIHHPMFVYVHVCVFRNITFIKAKTVSGTLDALFDKYIVMVTY